MLIAEMAIFLEGFQNDLFEPRGQCRPDLLRPAGLLVQDGAGNHRAGCAAKRRLAGGHLVQHESEREQIRADVDVFAAQLLRRHIGDRADRATVLGERAIGELRQLHRRGRHRLVDRRLGESKVENLRTVAGEKDVCRLDIAVDDARGVCRVERAGQCSGDLDELAVVQWSACQPPLQRFAVQQFHHQERNALSSYADVVDRADIRMLERGNRASLALEPRAPLWIGRHVGRQHFDGDRAIEPRVAGRVDLAHPARAERRKDLVGAEARAGGESHVQGCAVTAEIVPVTRAQP
jgi:hypothetical protein